MLCLYIMEREYFAWRENFGTDRGRENVVVVFFFFFFFFFWGITRKTLFHLKFSGSSCCVLEAHKRKEWYMEHDISEVYEDISRTIIHDRVFSLKNVGWRLVQPESRARSSGFKPRQARYSFGPILKPNSRKPDARWLFFSFNSWIVQTMLSEKVHGNTFTFVKTAKVKCWFQCWNLFSGKGVFKAQRKTQTSVNFRTSAHTGWRFKKIKFLPEYPRLRCATARVPCLSSSRKYTRISLIGDWSNFLTWNKRANGSDSGIPNFRICIEKHVNFYLSHSIKICSVKSPLRSQNKFWQCFALAHFNFLSRDFELRKKKRGISVLILKSFDGRNELIKYAWCLLICLNLFILQSDLAL